MSVAYIAAATVYVELGSRRVPLLDFDEDGLEDAGLIDRLIAKASRVIDARLAQKLDVPFAAITDTPATPDVIQEIALDLVMWRIYAHHDPGGRDEGFHFTQADTLLTSIAEGKADVDGAARQTGAKAGVVAVWEAEDPVFAGVDSNNISRTRGI